MNIYFICTGNTCRSPMAEAILRSKNIENVVVRSAGINAIDGVPIAVNSKTLINEASMPFSAYSSALTKENIEWADYIFTMTAAHKSILLHLFPNVSEKVFTLKGFVNESEDEDVLDPFGGTLSIYRKTFNELSVMVDELERKLMEG